MKTWEMIKALTENPKLKFKAQDGTTAEVAISGCLLIKDADRDHGEARIAGGCAELIPDEWELIPQEVPWREAIQGWADGKSVICKLSAQDSGTGLSKVHHFGRYPLSRNEIINGKWYIE